MDKQINEPTVILLGKKRGNSHGEETMHTLGESKRCKVTSMEEQTIVSQSLGLYGEDSISTNMVVALRTHEAP